MVRRSLEHLKSVSAAPWFANVVSIISLFVAILAMAISWQQASEAKRANDALQATRASNVYFDWLEADGHTVFYIANRNPQPIRDVYYTYKIEDVEAPAD